MRECDYDRNFKVLIFLIGAICGILLTWAIFRNHIQFGKQPPKGTAAPVTRKAEPPKPKFVFRDIYLAATYDGGLVDFPGETKPDKQVVFVFPATRDGRLRLDDHTYSRFIYAINEAKIVWDTNSITAIEDYTIYQWGKWHPYKKWFLVRNPIQATTKLAETVEPALSAKAERVGPKIKN
ncbi:MAG: hypothetical protein WCT32_00610 [Patescibacteria group bacterium]|jgi:hypothetical protein